MSAGRYDIEIEQGATFSETLTLRDSNKDLVDLTDYTAKMHVRENIDDTTTLLTSEGVSPTITLTLGGVAGTVTIAISDDTTAALSFASAVYDLILISTTETIRLLAGTVTLSQAVTR
jgi:hypothetical protein